MPTPAQCCEGYPDLVSPSLELLCFFQDLFAPHIAMISMGAYFSGREWCYTKRLHVFSTKDEDWHNRADARILPTSLPGLLQSCGETIPAQSVRELPCSVRHTGHARSDVRILQTTCKLHQVPDCTHWEGW